MELLTLVRMSISGVCELITFIVAASLITYALCLVSGTGKFIRNATHFRFPDRIQVRCLSTLAH